MDEFSTPQFSKTISNTNDTHDDYQIILGPYPYNVPLGFHWFLNSWKLKWIESTPTNVSFEQLFLNKVKPMQEKQKKNWMKLDLRAKIENPNILLYVQPHPQGILPFWYWKTRSFNLGHLNINSIHNKFEMLSMSVEQYVDILMLSETKFRPGHEWCAIAHVHTPYFV